MSMEEVDSVSYVGVFVGSADFEFLSWLSRLDLHPQNELKWNIFVFTSFNWLVIIICSHE